ncbi:hypothetical protein SAMN05444507_101542 [Pseudomonas syringae]|nr:hypothetical protein SAMN05444507_101542 [Pseudomonas syringae]
MPFRTLCVLLRRRASRTAFPRWSVGNDHLNYRATLCVVCLSGRSASSCDAELRELHSHAGACGTIISTIVRRSASYAFPDALRPLATQSVENCIPTLERRERSSQLSCDALRRMPFRTLCVLLRRRASGTAFSRWSVGNDHINYRATLCVVCLSGRSASSCDAERRELHCHAGA